MTRPLTDRERCLQLEARVAELEDEVAAWRAQGSGAARDDAYAARLAKAHRALQPSVGQYVLSAAHTVLELLERPGEVRRTDSLRRALCGEDTQDKGVHVRICRLRKGLAALGVGGAVRTVYRVGYVIDEADAPRVLAALGLAP